jgi:hypothetical protein
MTEVKDVKPEFVRAAVVTFFVMISVTPAVTASRQIQVCSKQALRANATFRHREDSAAFMANCIANHTPTPTQKRKYRK